MHSFWVSDHDSCGKAGRQCAHCGFLRKAEMVAGDYNSAGAMNPQAEPSSRFAETPPVRSEGLVRGWVWFVLKNVLGWLLILASLAVGPLIPGPGGIPLFLIGFALVTFPGKRRLTARLLRGRRFQHVPRAYSLMAFGISLCLPAIGAILLLYMTGPRLWLRAHVEHPDLVTLELYLSLALVLWLILRVSPRILNLALPLMPRMRRRIRPWLREHGIHLLPPRHRHQHGRRILRYTDNILVISERFYGKLAVAWRRHAWWLLLLAVLAAVGCGFWIVT